MNIGTNVAVDTSSSAFISAASQKDPLANNQWANATDTVIVMFRSTSILECFIYLTCFYLAFVFLGRHYFGQIEFMKKWQISRATAMDIACKTISAGFAFSATVGGMCILWMSAAYTPITKDRSSFFLDRVMIFAMSYFIYDFFAMYHVYLAQLDANETINPYRETKLSQTIKLHRTDVDKDSFNEKELITSIAKPNDNAVPASSMLNSNCDKSPESITGDMNGASTNVITKNNRR